VHAGKGIKLEDLPIESEPLRRRRKR